jgi:predicted transposase YbfD/YdcC
MKCYLYVPLLVTVLAISCKRDLRQNKKKKRESYCYKKSLPD